ncbi:MAG: PrpR N-terminal domain-containing protein [Eubacteriales bacterium]|nr:PrpR N-terminal domain-containing protein [Eubacteriales bacterium]
MQKTKILAVAPYEGMAEAISAIAQERDDIKMTVQVGDLDTGKKIALELAHNNYDVIISRGGTAELIRSTVELPVIDISISVYDVLRAIKLAENYSGKFVIAGFSGITSCARVLCDLLQYDINIITFTSENDAVPALRNARKDGCTLVLCDMAGSNAAKKLGMNAIPISSGTESIHSAIDAAVNLVHSSQHVHKQKDLFQALLTDEEREFLIYDPAGSLWFSSLSGSELNVSLMNLVQTYLKAFLKSTNQTVTRQIRDKIYILTSRHLYYEDQKYTAISIHQKDALFSEEDTGITIYNRLDYTSGDFLSYYNSSNKIGDTAHMIEDYSRSHLPVLIVGETGTGKDKVASFLYENGPYGNAPLYTINCQSMSERKWNSIISNDNSPLNTVHSTIYIKNPGALSKGQMDKLFTYIDHSNLAKRNRLIFSLLLNSTEYPETETARNYLENRLSCLTLKLSPLRERIADFPSITALYIHKMNTLLGKQIIGLEAEAMELMTGFSWPHNLDQLQRIIKELVLTTHTPYITYASVRQALSQEPSGMPAPDGTSFDLSGTLSDINYRIIQVVLEEEHGSKERTAQRLGISRSTLWRVLKNYK